MRLHARHEVARGDGGHHQGTDAQTKTPSMRLVVLGCSGGYPPANRGASLVERIEGDDLNVVGLPAALLSRLLAEHGYNPPPR